MKGRETLVTAGAVIALLGMAHAARAVAPCPDANNCVQVMITPPTATVSPGDVVTIGVTFQQAPGGATAGGPDKIAALAKTLNIAGSGNTTPLTLNDCTLNADGLPNAVHPDPAISNFKVVIENASCSATRTHCLCPDTGAGQTLDNFINIVVYGPNPLPTPGPTGIDIPVLPSGPLLTIDLKVAQDANGSIPLHVFNQVQDATKPQFTALLSVGDKTAVDQTCVPVPGTPPCSDPSSVSQVATFDATLQVNGSGCGPGDQTGGQCPAGPPCICVDDCDLSGDVFGNEVTKAVNIVAGGDLSGCPQADANCDGDVFGNEVTIGVNNVANGCPGAAASQ